MIMCGGAEFWICTDGTFLAFHQEVSDEWWATPLCVSVAQV